MRSLAFIALCLATVACGGGSNSDSTTDQSTDQPDDGMTDAPPLDGNVTPDGTPALVGTKHTLTYPVTQIEPGAESTKCVWMRLDNETEIKIHQLHNVLSNQSHHLIVYKDDMDTTEQLTPVACQPFAGALNATGRIAPFMITQKKDDPLTLPDGVAYTLAPHQMIKLEMHYLNATEDPQEGTATVELYEAVDATAIHDEANILFIGSPDINIPAGAMQTLHQFITIPASAQLADANVFAITGHTHHLGTDMQVATGSTAAGPFTSVYKPTNFLWSEPVTTTHSPAFKIPTGGGFDFQCAWTNPTTQSVTFGESANDEMCFFWAYYYPSHGSKVCIHTEQIGSLNVCCPVPDNAPASEKQLCNAVANQF